jgi:hypothetical protein
LHVVIFFLTGSEYEYYQHSPGKYVFSHLTGFAAKVVKNGFNFQNPDLKTG